MSHKEDCVFCQVIQGSIPSTIRYEDEQFIAINDIHPAAPEHILIIPKNHVETLEDWEIDTVETMGTLLQVARKVAHQLKLNDNYKLFMNVGQQVQIVHHLHLHLMGGWTKKEDMHINVQEM